METMFNILMNCRTVFQSSCIILHIHQQRVRVPVSPHPHQRLLLSIFLNIVILVGVKWYLIDVYCWGHSWSSRGCDHWLTCELDLGSVAYHPIPYLWNVCSAHCSHSGSHFQGHRLGTSLAVQWLRLCASSAGGVGSIPGQGTKIPHAVLCSQKIKLKKKKDTSLRE